MKRLRMNLERQKALYGVLFTMPFVVGFVLFFVNPFIKSMLISLSDIRFTQTGYELNYVGLKHYEFMLFVDTQYIRKIVDAFLQTLRDVPMVISFSLFSAIILNQKFRGRTLARVIFFLPVILSAGIVLRMERSDFVTQVLMDPDLVGAGGPAVFSDAAVRAFFEQLSLPSSFISFLMAAVDNVATIIRASGIQILVFLAGLQSIPASLYEAADAEGATGWERFWVVTFPMMTPLILVNVIFTIIDSFTAGNSEIMNTIYDAVALSSMGYSLSSAMAWFYFAFVAIVLAIVIKLVSKGVLYHQ